MGPLQEIDPMSCHLLKFDGGSRGNPGLAGCGFVILSPVVRATVVEKGERFERATNNVAEYEGIITGLIWAADNGIRNLVIEGDSMLIVEQLKGNYKAGKMRESYIRTMAMTTRFDYVAVRHVYRAENALADALANEAMDRGPFVRVLREVQRREPDMAATNMGFMTYVNVSGI